jgi:prolyl-tRNA editing enzyme YbaK/EbsC (Cys-tRNA(Pro) deacylase)
MASGAHRVDTDLLGRVLGATAIRKATPQFVLITTDQVIGGVAPTGHPNRLRTVVDETLAQYPVIWTAAGTADSVMSMTYEQLLVLTEGKAMPVR